MNQHDKVTIIKEVCKKIDIVNFKTQCIECKFKKVMAKYKDYNYINLFNDIESWSTFQILELENLYEKNYNNLLKLSKELNIDLYENQDINYFINKHNITFFIDIKPYTIEI